VLESSWSSEKSKASVMWSKLRHVITAVAQFRQANHEGNDGEAGDRAIRQLDQACKANESDDCRLGK
jgi:hypothetical protein